MSEFLHGILGSRVYDWFDRIFHDWIRSDESRWMGDESREACREVCSVIPASAQYDLTQDERELLVYEYYQRHSDRHDAAYVADRLGLSVGIVHDIRAGRWSLKEKMMSETEQFIGTLRQIHPEITDIEEVCRVLCVERGFERSALHSDFVECLKDEGYKNFVVNKTAVFEVVSIQTVDVYDDFSEATENPDGTISFNVRFYNGGCSFGEAVEHAISIMTKTDTPAVSDRELGRREGWAAFRDTLKDRVREMKATPPPESKVTIADVVQLINTHHVSHFWKEEQSDE